MTVVGVTALRSPETRCFTHIMAVGLNVWVKSSPGSMQKAAVSPLYGTITPNLYQPQGSRASTARTASFRSDKATRVPPESRTFFLLFSTLR